MESFLKDYILEREILQNTLSSGFASQVFHNTLSTPLPQQRVLRRDKFKGLSAHLLHKGQNKNLFSFIFRKKASNGLWLQFVLPITLLGGALKYKSSCSFLYWHFALLSMSFLINSVCGVLHYVNKCQLPLKQIGTLASMTTSSLLLTLYSFQGKYSFLLFYFCSIPP